MGIVDYVGPARDRIVDEVVATVLKGYEKVWRVKGVGGGWVWRIGCGGVIDC